jgi:hypothetical protein
VSEPGGQRAARIAETRCIAQALALQDPQAEAARSSAALEHLPERLLLEVAEWRERTRRNGWRLDAEQWSIGLLTLRCLDDHARARSEGAPPGQ